MKYNAKPNIVGDIMKAKGKMRKSPIAKALDSMKDRMAKKLAR